MQQNKSLPPLFVRVLPPLIASVFSGTAAAGGFGLYEQNASGLGNAFAGSAAVAQDASTIYFNPAGMAMLPGRSFVAGVDVLRTSNEFSNNASVAAAGRPLGGNGGDAGGWAGIPFGYLSWQLSPTVFLGVGLGAPFGLKTEYDSGWIGRFQATKSEIKSINLNPSLAWKVNDQFSLGFGVSYQRFEAQLGNKVNVLTVVGGVPVSLGEIDAKVTADDDSWGWNFGALFTVSPSTRIGASYRSTIKQKLEGDVSFGRTGNAAVDAGISANPLLANGPAKADVKLPDSFILSVVQQLTDKWEMVGDVVWTGWSNIPRLEIYRTNGALLSVEELQWDDTWRVALGGNYKYNDQWKIRFGLAFDESPVNDTYRAPRLPDSDKWWLSIGAQYKPNKDAAIDFAYTYLIIDDASINNSRGSVPRYGLINGEYDSSTHILGIQYSQSF